MALRLRIESTQNDVTPWEVNCVGDTASIGRDSKCTVMLPDPLKHLSRQHVTIQKSGRGYALTVNSKVNPVSVSGRDLAYGEHLELGTGDVLIIANFRISVQFDSAQPVSAATRADDPFSWLDELKPGARLPAVDLGGGTDPFADLMPSRPPPQNPAPDPFSQFAASAAKPDKHLVSGIGVGATGAFSSPLKSLDPLELLGSGRSSVAPAQTGIAGLTRPQSASPLDQWLNGSDGATAPSASPLVELSKPRPVGTPSLNHVHEFNVPFSPPPPATRSRAAGMDLDLSDLMPGTEVNARSDPAARTLVEPAAQGVWEGVTLPPSVTQSPRTLVPTHSDPGPVIGSSAALRAYLKGLGLDDIECPPEQAAEYLELAGSITRTAVAGVMQLLLSRSEMKKELRAADRTMLSARANNPLKMMASDAEALRFLFSPEGRADAAFMPPLAAISDACTDILAHEFGLVAGLRAAVIGAIKQCDPEAMEKLAEKQGRLGGILGNRKAQLWDSFVAWYRKAEETCADDVDRLFERDFLKAYMQQVEKIKNA